MKKFYIVDENGTYASANGEKRYTCLSGEELYNYLNSEEGKGKEFDIDIDDNGDEIGVEVPASMMKKHLVEKRRKQYVRDTEIEMGYTLVSLTSGYEGKDGEVMTYEDVITDGNVEFVEEIARKVNIKTLRKALASLSKEEYEIVYYLYLSDPLLSERAYGKKIGVSDTTLNYRKKQIIEKLKKFF